MRRPLFHTSVLALATLAALLPSHAALACGGCFTPTPNVPTDKIQVLQSAERILFVRDEKTKKSVVWVEVKYDGPSTDFAWVLPVPKKPAVGVGSSYLFDRLDQGTAPRFEVELAASENCNSVGRSSSVGCGSADSLTLSSPKSASGANFENGNRTPGVKVVEHDQIGPYDYQIVQGTNGQALFDWLNTNKYKLPDAAKPIVEDHVKKGDLFLAVRLKSGAGVQEIKPITLTMDDAEPCVPLRLTSIAAVEDTTVLAYIAGPARAIPKNYLHVQLNPMRLNWFDGGGNYGQVLSAAIDEAAGHAFLTEFAGAVPKTIQIPGEFQFSPAIDEALIDYTRLATQPFAAAKNWCDVRTVLVNKGFPVTSDTAAILEAFTGMATAGGQTDLLKFYTDLAKPGSACPAANPVDGAGLAAKLEKEFTKPLLEVMPMVTGAGKFTRLAMRISPQEMTKDPVFAFNPGLPDVANVRKATVASVCRTGDFVPDAQRLTVPGVGSFVVANSISGATPGGGTTASSALDLRWKTAPAAWSVEVLDETGAARPIAQDQIELVDAAIASALPGKPSVPPALTLKPAAVRWKAPGSDALFSSSARASESGGCMSGQSARGATTLAGLLAAVALILVAVRRRAR